MPSLLILSGSTGDVSKISAVAEPLGYRVRSISELDKAEEWLSLQRFDVFLLDSRYAHEMRVALIEYAWEQNPMTMSGVFSFEEALEDTVALKFMGCRLFVGPHGLDSLARSLEFLPSALATQEELGVLLVEDLDSPRQIIATYIEALGYPRVDVADSVDPALAILEKSPEGYFCVVSDINMPGKSGVDLVEAIRGDVNKRHIPIILLTAHASPENLIGGLKAGASGFLVKPPRKKQLSAELEKAKRLYLGREAPSLCGPGEADQLEEALLRLLG